MKNKIGTFVALVIIAFVLIGCNSAFGVFSHSVRVEGGEVKENKPSLNIPENIETVILEKDKVEITNINSFVDFIKMELNEEVEVFNHEKSYYNEYLDEYISESAEIVIENGDFYPLYMTVLFKDSKLLNVVLTYNKLNTDNGKYFDFINELYATLGYNCGLSEEKSEKMITELMDFDNYSNNVYDNPEYNGYFDNIYCLGVVFEDGKDFIFDGYTYYFSFFVNNYFVENEV